jgi:hypothetical protein
MIVAEHGIEERRATRNHNTIPDVTNHRHAEARTHAISAASFKELAVARANQQHAPRPIPSNKLPFSSYVKL